MANVQTVSVLPLPSVHPLAVRASEPHAARLATTALGVAVRIVRIEQEEEHAAWLRAVGLHEGAVVTVLRLAPFGGPLHLRSTDGGEFAIHRDLARCIAVAPVDAAPRT